jgi:hypothetical protein
VSLLPPDMDFDRYRDIRDEQEQEKARFVSDMIAIRDYYVEDEPPDEPPEPDWDSRADDLWVDGR